MLTKSLQTVAAFMSGQGTAIILLAAIVCGSLLGIALPDASTLLGRQIDFTILLLVFLLLFEVRIERILSSLNRIGFLAAALIANFVVIPAIGYAIASVFLSGYPIFLIGLVIYFMAPCTDWFLGFTRLAKGNTALGAALLPINMIVQLLLYPVYLQIFGIDTIDTAASDVVQTLVQWFLLPLLMAVAFRFVADRILNDTQMDRVQSVVSILVPVLLAILVGQISAANIDTLVVNAVVVPLILGAIFLFFLLTFFLSELISKVMKLTYEDRVLMTMTTSARNAPLMLALTMAVIPNQPALYAAIIIGMLVELPHLVALKSVLLRHHPSPKANAGVFDGAPAEAS
ncbi:MAG: arsenic resistance protein [Pseudomonadota bacterium]